MKWFDKLFPKEEPKGYHVSTYRTEDLKYPCYGEYSYDITVIKEFVAEYCQAGFTCKVYDYESNRQGIILSSKFDDSVDVFEQIEWSKLK